MPTPVVPSGVAAVDLPPSSEAEAVELKVESADDAADAQTPVAGGSSNHLLDPPSSRADQVCSFASTYTF